MTTALARIESTPAAELFKPGALDPVLDAIRAEVRREAACLDISTDANRKAIASLAFKVAKSKTFLDAQGKKLVAAEKDRLKVIDRERGRVWDELELLQAEVRKPLTDWENAEKTRVAGHEAQLQMLIDTGTSIANGWQTYPLDGAKDTLQKIQSSTYDWQEFHARAVAAVVKTIGQIKEAIAKREKYEAEQEELVQLRAAQAKRDHEERDAAIAKEASDRAEAAARLREQEQRQAAEAERQRIEHERLQAEARAKQAEAQRIEAEERAQREAAEAAERLKAQEARAKYAAEQAAKDREAALVDERERAALAARDAAAAAEASRQAAVEAERARAAEEKRKAAEDTAKREANRKHSAKINAEIRDALIIKVPSLDRADAILIINAISAGLIPHTKISY